MNALEMSDGAAAEHRFLAVLEAAELVTCVDGAGGDNCTLCFPGLKVERVDRLQCRNEQVGQFWREKFGH
jgi:hypothetical protein